MSQSFPQIRARRVGIAGAWLAFVIASGGCRPEVDQSPDRAGGRGAKVEPAPAPAAGAGVRDDRSGMGSGAPPIAPNEVPQEPSPFRFEDVAKSGGVDFVHVSGMTAAKHYPTANGSGVAVFDHDGDGLMDLYFATGALLPLGKSGSEGPPNRLYKNLGGGKFRDATEESGLGFRGYCHGVIVGDVDNDGDPDVFLANYGGNRLYLNDGKGKFADVTEAAGIDRPAGWSSSGAFLDYDNDGDLDLYVSRYGDWNLPDDDKVCTEGGVRLYCSPKSVRTVRHILYRNEWKETGKVAFADVTEAAGVARDDGHGFGVVTGDFDGDGKIDIYVANDMNPNFLFLNKGDGTFLDATDMSGAAYDKDGRTQSGMGIDAEDVNGDGLPDLFVTNFQNEYNTLYQNTGGGNFVDQTAYYNLVASSLPWVGWGCALADFDNDGWPDCFVANGHVDDNRRKMNPPQPVDEEEPALLLKNEGGIRFRLATRDAGDYFAATHTGRGAAFGDLDDDGRLDIVVNHRGNPAAVLLNRTPDAGKWLRLKLVGTRSNRDAIGARVEVEVKGRVIHRSRKGGASLMASHDPRLLIGLGDAAQVVRLTVRWPSGLVSERRDVEVGKTIEVVEGEDGDAPKGGDGK